MNVTISVKGRFHAFYLARELQRHGCLQQLITSFPIYDAKRYGIHRRYIKSLVWYEVFERVCRRARLPYRWITRMYDWHASRCINEQTDIVVGWSGMSLSTLHCAHKQGKKVIIEHGSTHPRAQNQWLEAEYQRYGLPYTPMTAPQTEQEFAECDKIAIPSSFVKTSFINQGVAKSKLIQIPYGVDTTKFYPHQKMDTTFRVIFCGSLCIRKGIGDLLQAFYSLKLPDAELWLIGTLSPEAEMLLNQYPSDRIIYKGKFKEHDLPWHYSQGSVFCLPSLEEGMALVTLQAMACGLPLIVTPNTGAGDVIEDGHQGYIIPIRQPEAIQEKLMYLYQHPQQCHQMGQAALERVQNHFTWTHYGQRIMACYQELLTTDDRHRESRTPSYQPPID